MTMPSPLAAQRKGELMLAAARAVVADPNNLELRRAYMMATFNLDYAAAGIVSLADGSPAPELVVLRDEDMAVLAGFLPSGEGSVHSHIRAWWPGKGEAELDQQVLARITLDSSIHGHLPNGVREILRKRLHAFGDRAVWLEL